MDYTALDREVDIQSNGFGMSICYSTTDHRYILANIFGGKRPKRKQPFRWLVYVMLNPSTAAAAIYDPTAKRCAIRAQMMGYDGFIIINLFAVRSTDPYRLMHMADPVGAHNDDVIRAVLRGRVGFMMMGDRMDVICGWGAHGKLMNRDDAVMAMFDDARIKPYCLKKNSNGTPGHPLYIQYLAPFLPYSMDDLG